MKSHKKVIILGTGGTIAGLEPPSGELLEYKAAQVDVASLLQGVAMPHGIEVLSEQVAQIDSKNMNAEVWRGLIGRVLRWQKQADIAGIVITHGTDTIEETAFLLACIQSSSKPIVLTCAMLPANAPQADGPQNLADAIVWACDASNQGVSVVCAGQIHEAWRIQKIYTDRLDAFDSGAHGVWGVIQNGQVVLKRNISKISFEFQIPSAQFVVQTSNWPRVWLIPNHSGSEDLQVLAWLEYAQSHAINIDGIVLAGTGNGTANDALERALNHAQTLGIKVWRSSRCYQGVQRKQKADAFTSAGYWSPYKARIALILDLLYQLESASKARALI
ncbi:MAG: asparaginase [Limnohabitans sp.]|nr:asparaginase [Limnohabitans sp.]